MQVQVLQAAVHQARLQFHLIRLIMAAVNLPQARTRSSTAILILTKETLRLRLLQALMVLTVGQLGYLALLVHILRKLLLLGLHLSLDMKVQILQD
jgi:hypothetical protein